METIYKTFRAETKAVDIEEGIIDMLIPMSTGSIDRDGESIDPMGWKKSLPSFRKRPILLSSHDYRDLKKQIGEFVSIKANKDGLFAKPKYYINEGNEEADWGFKLASKGMAAFSVGFLPTKWEDGEDDKGPKRTYTEQELLEVSHVVVPSNRDAIQDLRAKSIDPIVDEVLDDVLNDEELTAEPEEVLKPYPNEHACRLKDPGAFQEGSFRRTSRTSGGKKYSIIMGRLKGETTMTEQAYRYNKGVWDASAARSHCKEHGGSFEAAQAMVEEVVENETTIIQDNETVPIDSGPLDSITEASDIELEDTPEESISEEEIVKDTPENKAVTQAEIIDELDYLIRCLDGVGLNVDAQKEAWGLVREVIRLSGDDIPVDIAEKVRDMLGKKNKDKLNQIKSLVQEVIDSAQEEQPEPKEDDDKSVTLEMVIDIVQKAVTEAIAKAQGKV